MLLFNHNKYLNILMKLFYRSKWRMEKMKSWQHAAIGGLASLVLLLIIPIKAGRNLYFYHEQDNKIINEDPNVLLALDLQNKLYFEPGLDLRKAKEDSNYLNEKITSYERRAWQIKEYANLLSPDLTEKLRKLDKNSDKSLKWLIPTLYFSLPLGAGALGYTLISLKEIKSKKE